MPEVSVAIPVRDGGELFVELLAALSRQTVAHELVVCDSGSADGSVELARRHGARVIEIAPERFSHGGTRNLLVESCAGTHVALLTQDAVPAQERWLQALLDGFGLARNVGIVYGPYRPRPGASTAVRVELEGWFSSLSPDGSAQVERLGPEERALPAIELIGRRGFFTDANACIAREAWQRVPFRDVPYAEDRVLAIEMLRAGYAKAFVPDAAVIHSHAYTPSEQLRRSFDEWRALREIYGWREPASPRHLGGRIRGALGQARRALALESASPVRSSLSLTGVVGHQLASLSGALLGSRAERLPAGVRRRLSLEGHASFTAAWRDPAGERVGLDRPSAGEGGR